MLADLDTNQILIKDKTGKFKIAQLKETSSDKSDQEARVKPVRTMFDISSTGFRTVPGAGTGGRAEPGVQLGGGQPGANFYFAIEDEEEIKQIQKKKSQLTQAQLSNIIQAYARAVLDKSMLNLGLGLKRRLLRVIESRLRDIRDLIETKEVLKRSIDLGGIGLDSEQTNQLIKIIEQERAGIEELASKARDFKKSVFGLRQSALKEMDKQAVIDQGIKTGDLAEKQDHYVHPSYKEKGDRFVGAQKVISAGKSIKEDREDKVGGVSSDLKSRELHIAGPDRVKALPPKTKDKMLRLAKRVIGPIEELEQMTVKEFRDLGANLDESVEKIVNKLEILEDESVNERAKGLAAWRHSPLYRDYLNIGQASIAAQKSVEQYIRELAANERLMTFEEFEAIADLNKKLSF